MHLPFPLFWLVRTGHILRLRLVQVQQVVLNRGPDPRIVVDDGLHGRTWPYVGVQGLRR